MTWCAEPQLAESLEDQSSKEPPQYLSSSRVPCFTCAFAHAYPSPCHLERYCYPDRGIQNFNFACARRSTSFCMFPTGFTEGWHPTVQKSRWRRTRYCCSQRNSTPKPGFHAVSTLSNKTVDVPVLFSKCFSPRSSSLIFSTSRQKRTTCIVLSKVQSEVGYSISKSPS